MINNSLVIGVAGGSGSGKSTFAKRICDYFGDKAVLISCDNYYLAHDDIPLEKRAKLNYDIPEAFVLCDDEYAETVYFTCISAKALAKRGQKAL